jgi:hypothetical protein
MAQAEMPGERWFSVQLEQAPLELYARATDSQAAARQVLLYCFNHPGLGLGEQMGDFETTAAEGMMAAPWAEPSVVPLAEEKALHMEKSYKPYMRPDDSEHHIEPFLATDKRGIAPLGVPTVRIPEKPKVDASVGSRKGKIPNRYKEWPVQD